MLLQRIWGARGGNVMGELWVQLVDLKLKVSTAEQEREFYFTKLRDIEVMCQMPEVKQERVSPIDSFYHNRAAPQALKPTQRGQGADDAHWAGTLIPASATGDT